MKFWDREKEKRWLKHYLLTEPNSILFVYGPKSSGKTTLLMKVVEELSRDTIKTYWYDLRGKVISGYEDVLRVFFREKGWGKKVLDGISKMLKIDLNFFELDGGELLKVINKEVDAFEIMEDRLSTDKNSGKRPVIVFDELQKLKDIYLNGGSQRPLIKELFNFFVRLTKVLHLAHVIVMTSDTFFIEQVYFDSTLENTSRYYSVDYFDDKTAKDILISEGISERESEKIVEISGGVPWILREVIKDENPIEVVNELYKQTKSKMIELIGHDERYLNILKEVAGEKNLYGTKDDILKELVEREILFMDPVNGEIRFQTRLHERAAREVLKAIR